MEKIELRKARDFGALFNDSIAFLRTNFKSFFGIIFLLAGPFVLLTGLLMGYLQFVAEQIATSNVLAGRLSGNNIFLANSASTILISILIFLLTTLVTNASIALYFKFYDKASREKLPIQRSNIAPLLASACLSLFYNLLLLVVVLTICTLAFVGILYFLFLIPVLKIILIIALAIACIIFLPAFIYVLTVANFIVIRDEILITAAIGKAINCMRGNFWQTWIFIFCSLASLSMLYLLFNMSYVIQGFISGFARNITNVNSFSARHTLLFIIFTAVSMLGRMLIINPILTCFCVFNFYNQEERHEGTSLLNRIDTFDKN